MSQPAPGLNLAFTSYQLKQPKHKWSTVLVTALGSWEESVPRGHSYKRSNGLRAVQGPSGNLRENRALYKYALHPSYYIV
jgi:hypothetical protein